MNPDDPWLKPYLPVIRQRARAAERLRDRLTNGGRISLYDAAGYHRKMGLHRTQEGWVFREWAPAARAVWIIGEGSGWEVRPENALVKTDTTGIWEGCFPKTAFRHQDLYCLRLDWGEGPKDRMPTAATRLVQDPHTLIFNAQVWTPEQPYGWRYPRPSPEGRPLLIYEAHTGMAQEREGIGTYLEFARTLLPRVRAAGYTAIQLMAVQEHPYYASFGYHVTGFFAPSSRFGTPDELKQLVDEAHGMGLMVLMDLVHSHAARNEVEGPARFDGTRTQFFHAGDRGIHPLWDSCCFNYERPEVSAFLLSNCRYWLEDFHMDGFRFDGVTSMVYLDHGINRTFSTYTDYFGQDVDDAALGYLSLANQLIHEIHPSAVTIAEEVSGYPGMAGPREKGGMGFDYRFAMGVPDFWIRILKEYADEDWPLGQLWHELNARRTDEKTISYAESHDQALVGDQTLMMRLMGGAIYTGMRRGDDRPEAFRAVSLHKMIRLITLACAGHGYLNFMGNEFGHPEWIDFPTAANGWSYRFARRQWSLADDPGLYYHALGRFDQSMIQLAREYSFLGAPPPHLHHLHQEDKVIAFSRGGLVFVFNFHPTASFPDYGIPAPLPGRYRMVLSTEDAAFGGKERLSPGQVHFTHPVNDEGNVNEAANAGTFHRLSLYLPSRSAQVFRGLAG